jgi:hypothetical protein
MGCPQACGVAISCSACGLLNSLHYVYGLLVDHFFSYGLLISNIVDALTRVVYIHRESRQKQ